MAAARQMARACRNTGSMANFEEPGMLPEKTASLRAKITRTFRKAPRPEQGASDFMVHPSSNFRRAWDVVLSILIVYCSTMLPLYIAFGINENGWLQVRPLMIYSTYNSLLFVRTLCPVNPCRQA